MNIFQVIWTCILVFVVLVLIKLYNHAAFSLDQLQNNPGVALEYKIDNKTVECIYKGLSISCNWDKFNKQSPEVEDTPESEQEQKLSPDTQQPKSRIDWT